jgi:SET domain
VYSLKATYNEKVLNPCVHEVKVSRADFLADVAKPEKRAGYAAVAESICYVAPVGMIAPEEVPDECGLLVETGPGVFEQAKRAKKRAVQLSAATFMRLLLKRGSVQPLIWRKAAMTDYPNAQVDADPLHDLVKKWLNTLPMPKFHHSIEHRESAIAGRGIHATRKILAGEVLVEENGPIVSQRTINIVHAAGYECELRVGWRLYSLHRPVHDSNQGGYINHSCEPNAGLSDIRTFAAVRDIEPGEEITCDYGTFETERGWTLPCSCGSKQCRKVITACDYLLPELRSRLSRYMAPYLQDSTLTGRLRRQYLPLSHELDELNEFEQAVNDADIKAMVNMWQQLTPGAR